MSIKFDRVYLLLHVLVNNINLPNNTISERQRFNLFFLSWFFYFWNCSLLVRLICLQVEITHSQRLVFIWILTSYYVDTLYHILCKTYIIFIFFLFQCSKILSKIRINTRFCQKSINQSNDCLWGNLYHILLYYVQWFQNVYPTLWEMDRFLLLPYVRWLRGGCCACVVGCAHA